MATALQNVVPSHLMDGTLHDFRNLKATGVPDADGDTAFDEAPLPEPVGAPFGGVALVHA
jgi:tRNA 2-thiocytidine biosynthesis protein TtcA